MSTETAQDVIDNGIQHHDVGARKVGTQGGYDMSVSDQWWFRPEDQRFTSLDSLFRHCRTRAERSSNAIVPTGGITFHALPGADDRDELMMGATAEGAPMYLTNWAFSQIASHVKAPTSYLRTLPPKLAGVCLQFGYSQSEVMERGLYYYRNDNSTELRAMTGPKYGRILDMEVVRAVQDIAGNGTGDTRWKIPGVMSWGDYVYDPDAPVTKSTTTLFASDRDVFMFLCDDKNPIEVGKLPNGDPDLCFRGFYVTNSEVGKSSLKITTMLLRAVCQNRILWGVQNSETVRIIHSSGAYDKFCVEAGPALERYANAGTLDMVTGIQEAQKAIVADNEDDAKDWLRTKAGYTKPECNAIINQMFAEEGEGADLSIWNLVQGATARARNIGHQDTRIEVEEKAAKMLELVA